MRAGVIAIGCAVGLAVAAPAAPAEPRWYGQRIVAVDGTSDALLLVGLFGDSALAGYAGLAGYVLGGPIIHATRASGPGPAAAWACGWRCRRWAA